MMVRGEGGDLTRVVRMSVSGIAGATRPSHFHSSPCPSSSCLAGSTTLLAKSWSNQLIQLPLSVCQHSLNKIAEVTVQWARRCTPNDGGDSSSSSTWYGSARRAAEYRCGVLPTFDDGVCLQGIPALGWRRRPLVCAMAISSPTHSIHAAAHRCWAISQIYCMTAEWTDDRWSQIALAKHWMERSTSWHGLA